MSTKYEPLRTHLSSRKKAEIPMRFSEIEAVIADRLPDSARKHRAWWSNNPTNSVITHAWLEAGYKTAQVNLEGETVVFVRQTSDLPSGEETATPDRPSFYGALKGQISAPDMLDLTEPAEPGWGKVYE